MSTKIYVLQLEDGKYYVGKTKDVDLRFAQHLQGGKSGAAWTSKYRPVRVIEAVDEESPYHEDIRVKQMMNKFGIDNVRGGSYSQIQLPEADRRVLEKEIRTARNECYTCGGSDHLVAACPKSSEEQKGRETCLGLTVEGVRCQCVLYLNEHGYCVAHRNQAQVYTQASSRAPTNLATASSSSENKQVLTCLGVTKAGDRCQTSLYLVNGYCSNHRYQGAAQHPDADGHYTEAYRPPDAARRCRGITRLGVGCRSTRYLSKDGFCSVHARPNGEETWYPDEDDDYAADPDEDDDEDVVCYRCGQPGHYASSCFSRLKYRRQNDWSDDECRRCGRRGHWAQDCYAS